MQTTLRPVLHAARDHIARFEDQVLAIESRPVHTRRIVFYGNSFFAFWDPHKMEQMLRGMDRLFPVTRNHGFGGATSAELLHYYPRLVRPYAPDALVFTEGANDFEQGYSPEEAFAHAQELFDRFSSDFPNSRLILLSALVSPLSHMVTWEGLGSIPDLADRYDALQRQYVQAHPQCRYIRVAPFFYREGQFGRADGFKDIFREDNVHLTDDGYDQMALWLGPQIQAALA